MIFIGTAETLGALALIAGLLAQLAALGFVILMIGTTCMKMFKWHMPFSSEKATGWELDFVLFAAAIILLVSGAGNISLDALLAWWP